MTKNWCAVNVRNDLKICIQMGGDLESILCQIQEAQLQQGRKPNGQDMLLGPRLWDSKTADQPRAYQKASQPV